MLCGLYQWRQKQRQDISVIVIGEQTEPTTKVDSLIGQGKSFSYPEAWL